MIATQWVSIHICIIICIILHMHLPTLPKKKKGHQCHPTQTCMLLCSRLQRMEQLKCYSCLFFLHDNSLTFVLFCPILLPDVIEKEKKKNIYRILYIQKCTVTLKIRQRKVEKKKKKHSGMTKISVWTYMGVCGGNGSNGGRKDLCTLITNMHGYRYRYGFPFPLFFYIHCSFGKFMAFYCM